MKIMDYLDSQPEFSKPIGAYVNMLVTETRVKKGRRFVTSPSSTGRKRPMASTATP